MIALCRDKKKDQALTIFCVSSFGSVKVCEMMFSLATKLATARTSGSAFNFISSTYNRLVTVICFPSVWDVWSCTDFLWKRNGKHLFGNTTELNTMQTGNLITSVRGKELVSATTDYIKLLLDIFQTMPKNEHCFSLEMNF